MALDKNLSDAIVSHISRKWLSTECGLCGKNAWDLYGHITLLLSDRPGLVVPGAPSLPCAAVVCQNCGNTILLSLVAAGLVGGAAR